MGPYTIVGLDLSTSLGVSVPTALSSPTLTLIGTSPPYATNEVYLFGTNQTGSYDTYVSLYAGPSGSQKLIIPNGGHGNANPLSFATRYLLNSPIPPNTDLWATALYAGGTAGSINVSVGLTSNKKRAKAPIQFLGSSTPPGSTVTGGSTANTMGAWVELGTVSYYSERLLINCSFASYTYSGVIFVGIGTNPSSPALSIPANGEGSYAMQLILDLDFETSPGMILSVAYQSAGGAQTANTFAHVY